MPDYRRSLVAGGTYFFTVALRDRRSELLVEQVEVLRKVVGRVRTRMPFHVDAWVVLPEHMHCVWTLPEGDCDYPGRWKAIKDGFSRRMEAGEVRSTVRVRRGERGIWQRRYWEHTIRDAADHAAHVDYVHFNPVKHGLVREAKEWGFSSFRQCVARGMYSADWAGRDVEGVGFGERGG